MKLNRRQLRFLLEQEAKTTLKKDAVAQQIKKTVGDSESDGGEGGASGFDPIMAGLEQLEKDEDAELPEELDSEEEIKAFIDDEIDDIVKHASGDYVDTSGLQNENVNNMIQKLIAESLDKYRYK